MRRNRITTVLLALLAAISLATLNLKSAKADLWTTPLQDRDPQKPLQHEVASRTAKFSTVEKTDALYTSALDAHALSEAQKLIGKTGAFKGKVSKLFEERDGDIVVLDFDPNYRTALTAVLRNADFPKFPDVRTLDGKEVVVSGKFVDYHGSAQIELTDPAQIKFVK